MSGWLEQTNKENFINDRNLLLSKMTSCRGKKPYQNEDLIIKLTESLDKGYSLFDRFYIIQQNKEPDRCICGNIVHNVDGIFKKYCSAECSKNAFSKNRLNKGEQCPDIILFKKMIEEGKTQRSICEHFNITTTKYNTWCRNNGIDDDVKELQEKEAIYNLIQEGKLIPEISLELNIPSYRIRSLVKKYNIEYKNQFIRWKENYNDIIDIIPQTLEKPLYIVAKENNISYEQLKKSWKQYDYPIVKQNKPFSKQEYEVRDYVRSLFNNDIKIGSKFFYDEDGNKFEIDIIKENIGIEYCGVYWHSFPRNENKYHIREKIFNAKKQNIDLITIFDYEWLDKQAIVKSIINHKFGFSKKIYARNCEISEIDSLTAKQFQEENHLNGYVNSSINIGCFHNGILVSVLSLAKNRFKKDEEYEITRFSTKQNFAIVGGLSKLFSYFIKKYDPISCTTYSDLRYGFGAGYLKLGFSFANYTPPNYKYYKNGKIFSRQVFQKKNLIEMNNYSDDKTEKQIMLENDFNILYDSGNSCYIYKKSIINK